MKEISALLAFIFIFVGGLTTLFVINDNRVDNANKKFTNHCLNDLHGAKVIYGDKDLCLDKTGRIIDNEKHNASWF